MRDLEGKLALVTGGGKGVGKVVARDLAARGAHVLLNFFHSLDQAKQTKAELEAAGAAVDLLRASVAQPAQVTRMFDEIEEKFGYLDILVNNSASGRLIPVSDVDEEAFARALDTNLKGSFWCARAAAPLMARRGGGCIVNVSSIGADLVPANYVVVGTSKAALEALTRYLAVEFAPLNIRVNTASCTLIDGDVARAFPDFEEVVEVTIGSTPFGRLATAEDLAGVIEFLTSDRSRFVTGQTVLADGGLSLGNVMMSPRRKVTSAAVGTDTQAHEVLAPADTGPESDDLAVVGMGLVVPGANSPEEFWKILVEGPNLFRPVPEDRWDYEAFYSEDLAAEDKTYSASSVFITDFSPVDGLTDGLSGETANDDSTALWLRHALLQAFRGVHRREGDRYSFVVGYTADGSQHLEESQVISGTAHRLAEAMAQTDVPPAERDELEAAIDTALRAHYRRGAGEPIRYLPHNVGRRAMEGALPEDTELVMVDTACSSSLYTVDIGVKGLLMGRQDIAVCGGSFSLAPRGSVLFSKLHGLSASGVLRPLDKNADGVLFSDGAGVVVIKRLQRAIEDGDHVLAVLKAFGSSSDGRGKAIYAPSSEGQQIAVERALAATDGEAAGIDWLIAHATGTPAGDLAEFTNLRETYTGDHPIYVTSNKSLIGHTGWAAGAVSVIEGILGLENAMIPPQHQFSEPPADFGIETTNLTIPTSPVPWPKRPDLPRRVAISGFGFGGTNAHLILEEYPAPSPAAAGQATRPRTFTGRIAVVGWSACVPELETRDQVSSWLAGEGQGPARSFGDFYPMPSFDKVRMPPAMIRTIDRCQLMVIECAHQLQGELGEFWEANRARTGVILGHLGATRTSTLYAGRTYLDDVDQVLRADPKLAHSPHLETLLDALRAEVQRLVPASNENSFPGMMPNVIPARIANYFDLNGLNMTVDAGVSSALAAVRVGIGYLRSGELDMALVGGSNGNTTAETRALLEGELGSNDELAEGTFILALTTEERATEAALPILGYVSEGPAVAPSNGDLPVLECSSGNGGGHYLGAQGALDVLRALHSAAAKTVVTCRNPRLGASASVTVASAGEVRQPVPASTAVPTRFFNLEEYAPGKPLEVRRQVAVLESFPLEPVRPRQDFIPPDTVVLTDRPELLAPLAAQLGEALVLSVTPPADPSTQVFLPAVTPEAVANAIENWGRPFRHIRVVADLGASAPAPDCLWEESASLVALHDLAFLTLQSGFDRLSEDGSSFIGLYVDALPDGNLHPLGGLFSGLMKSAALELPDCLVCSIFTSTGDLRTAVAQAEDESEAKHFLPLIAYDDGTRKTVFLDEDPGQLSPDGPARIDSSSVVVAVGGARGITAEVMKALAEHFRPRLYLIATTNIDAYPSEVFEGTDAEFASRRAEFIRTERAAHPEKNPGQVNKEFDRMVGARNARANLDEMSSHCGSDRVTYIAANVLDRDALGDAIARVLAAEGKIDLLINAPGINRAASIPQKSFADFCAVRDLKLGAYQNLKRALRDNPPRMWCNFGSFIGLTGQRGETDYASGNDLLSTGAGYSSRTLGRDEFTIGWTLWGEVGMGSNPIMKDFLEKSGLFTSMATGEGVHHFVREVNLSRHEPFVIPMGAAETQALTSYRPGYFERQTQPRPAAASPGFYLGSVLSEDRDEALFERIFDLDTDAYLDAHVVNGYPTLPGTFVTEVGAEAAAYLCPDLKVVGLEDARFHHFLRVYGSEHPIPKRIEAKVIERGADRASVRVRILTDVVAPNGTILARDRVHHEITAIMARDYAPAPTWELWSPDGEIPVPDPYHLPGAPVLLSGPLVSTRDTRSNPMGKRATYKSSIAPDDPAFSRFLVPSVMLDGLARVAVLEFVEREYIPLAAPSSIRRVDFYEPGNDCELARRYDPIELYVTPKTMTLEDPNAPNRFVAVRPDGRMILQMKGVVGIILGYVHYETGAYVAREKLERRSFSSTEIPVHA